MAHVSALSARPDGVRLDRRDDREAIEVALPFELLDGARVIAGERLSRSQLVVADEEPVKVVAGAPARDVRVRVPLRGFELVLPMRVVPGARSGNGTRRYDIVEMDARSEATLAQLIRSALTGWLPEADDLASGWDDETPLKSSPPAPRRRVGWTWLLLSVVATILVAGVAVVGLRVHAALTTIEADAAAVTAPRYDIFSPEYGTVADGVVAAGSPVVAEQPLVRVASELVEAALALELAGEAQSAGAGPAGDEDARAAGRIRALERRRAALEFTARCTCTVLWAVDAGFAVAPGALLMSLVDRDPDRVRVEALVSARQALDIRPGQRGEVTLAGDARRLPAVVEALRYESSPIPRVGLGADRNGRVTVVMRIDEAAADLVPGTPVNATVFK